MTSDDQDNDEHRFKQCIWLFILALQTERVVDVDAFQKIDSAAVELAHTLRGHPLVSKSLLNGWRMGIKAIRAEAPYFGEQTLSLVEMADKLEMTFDLVLMGESPEDRVPGVPRAF